MVSELLCLNQPQHSSSVSFSRIWDTATGQCLKTLIDEDNPPVYVTFLFSCDVEGLLWSGVVPLLNSLQTASSFWSAHSITQFRCGTTLRANASRVTPATSMKNTASSPASPSRAASGLFLVPFSTVPRLLSQRLIHLIHAGSEDHKIYLWNLQTKEIVQTLEGHKG